MFENGLGRAYFVAYDDYELHTVDVCKYQSLPEPPPDYEGGHVPLFLTRPKLLSFLRTPNEYQADKIARKWLGPIEDINLLDFRAVPQMRYKTCCQESPGSDVYTYNSDTLFLNQNKPFENNFVVRARYSELIARSQTGSLFFMSLPMTSGKLLVFRPDQHLIHEVEHPII